MGKVVSKIVLTGGPCAGKTSALNKIEKELSEKGYRVFVVPESATEIINGGIRPFGNKAVDYLKFQELIITYQVYKDKMYEAAALSLPEEEQCIIIYDRGVIDNKAYIGQELFTRLLDDSRFDEIELLENYDMVIHLVTAANGALEHYTKANNEARSETPEEAIELDKRTLEAWLSHKKLEVIDNSTNFELKLERTINVIYTQLNLSYQEYGFLGQYNEETPMTKRLSV